MVKAKGRSGAAWFNALGKGGSKVPGGEGKREVGAGEKQNLCWE